ncbi:hypothetical protein ARMSODRAFT_978640 [Armillaria solidipes]|uniref:F-box domain-containing protein n=1 Tax=Armillaria solidipes TaxID=1076256 RepID=A0A2H3BK56_9AGAR|nr:hypothetical protein ARMSODRAFT_978640 [Armillaria solidipes]
MQLLDFPHELLSYIVHFADLDTLCELSLTEKRIFHNIARDFHWRNITVIFGTDPNPKLNIFSFDSGHLEAIRSLSVVVDGDFDASLSSFTLVLPSMTNISHICICMILWRLTDADLSKMKKLSPVDTCRDTGRHDLLHSTHALEFFRKIGCTDRVGHKELAVTSSSAQDLTD